LSYLNGKSNAIVALSTARKKAGNAFVPLERGGGGGGGGSGGRWNKPRYMLRLDFGT